MLRAQGISASYRDTVVLHGVDLHVAGGEFVGIIGPNGTGKTTLLKVLTGVKAPLAGTVELDGRNMHLLPRRAIAALMAVVPQSSFVPPLFTVGDVVSIGRYARRESRFSESAADRAAVDNALAVTGTAVFRERFISELSGGERQEVLIARALAQQPKLLILDEPTANLDIRHQMKILGLVRRLISAQGLTALMVIHDLNLAARFCSSLVLLHQGRVLARGSAAEVLTAENLARAYGVAAAVEYNATVGALQVTTIGCLPGDASGAERKEIDK
jgi:iron complex transport system ATP-binding protein